MESGRADAATRVKSWTRSRFGEATVMVTELETAAGLNTVVAFWTPDRKHYHFKVPKPLEAVIEADLPPGADKDALAVIPGVDCRCC
jgi:hypothetical protein